MAQLAIPVLIAGGVMSAASSIQQGRLAAAQGRAEEKFAEFNAKMMEREAKSKMEAARIEEQRVSKRARAIAGRQRAAMAASGIDVSTGTALDILAETASEGYSDRALTLRQGLLQKVDLEAQAAASRAQGKLAKDMGKATRNNAYMMAAGQLALTGFTAGSALSAGSGLTSAQQAAFSAGRGPMSVAGANQWAAGQAAASSTALNTGFAMPTAAQVFSPTTLTNTFKYGLY